MKKHIATLITLVAGILFCWTTASADPNSCEDYFMRHFKKDLKTISVSFQNKTVMGDIPFPHQKVYLKLKNIGALDFDTLGGATRHLRVKLNSRVIRTDVKMPWKTGETRTVSFIAPRDTLTHCRMARVHIDIMHTVGQVGCQVWNNDASVNQANIYGRMCYIARPIAPIQ